MSDPTSPEVHDFDYVDCDICGRINTVTVWVQPRTGAWVRESFTCYCGEYHGEIDGNDRGATQFLAAVFMAGLAIVIAGICLTSTWLIVIGFAVMLPTPTIGVLAALQRKENDS